MRAMIETELWCYEQLEAREMTVQELYALSPIVVCPEWRDVGAVDPVTGLRGYREMSVQTVYAGLERLRLRGKVGRRSERGRSDGSNRRCWVYFRVDVPLEGEIAALETALRSEEST